MTSEGPHLSLFMSSAPRRNSAQDTEIPDIYVFKSEGMNGSGARSFLPVSAAVPSDHLTQVQRGQVASAEKASGHRCVYDCAHGDGEGDPQTLSTPN